MKLIFRKRWIAGSLFLIIAFIMSSCVATKKASIPSDWSYDLNWDGYNTVQLSPSDHILIQDRENMLMLDGNNGHVVDKDIRKKGGLFSEIGHDMKVQMEKSTLQSQRIHAKYFYKELTGLNTMLLFNRLEEKNTISSIDLTTGKKNWENNDYRWNLNDYKDVANIILKQHGVGDQRANDETRISFRARRVKSMIQAVPEKNAFLFRSVNKLYFIDNKSGKVLWSTKDVDGTGIGAVLYLPDSNQILMAMSMAGLKDLLKEASDDQSMKQLILLNAKTGKIAWKSEYKGRSEQVNDIQRRKNLVLLNFKGGSTEFFHFNDGSRIFGTRDEGLEGDTKLASSASKFNLYETPETAMPQIKAGSVYAVNPKTSKAVGIPDKMIQKFDLKTGDEIWSHTLKNTLDIRDMLFRGNNLIVRLSAPGSDKVALKASQYVGKKKPLGFYAFSQKNGKLDWKLTKPFEKHVTNVIYGDNEAWAAGGETLYKFSLRDGHIIADSSLSEKGVGIARRIYDDGNKIVYFGAKGMAVLSKDSLKTLYYDTPKGHLGHVNISNRFLVMEMSPLLSQKSEIDTYNLSSLSKIASFSLQPPDKKLLGRLGVDGFFTTDDFKQIVTLTESGIKSYKLY